MADEDLNSRLLFASAQRAVLATRYFWFVAALSVLIFAAWVTYGLYYNAHTSSTVGGPLTVVLCIGLGFASDLLLWALAIVAGLAFGWRQARGQARGTDDSHARA